MQEHAAQGNGRATLQRPKGPGGAAASPRADALETRKRKLFRHSTPAIAPLARSRRPLSSPLTPLSIPRTEYKATLWRTPKTAPPPLSEAEQGTPGRHLPSSTTDPALVLRQNKGAPEEMETNTDLHKLSFSPGPRDTDVDIFELERACVPTRVGGRRGTRID